MPNVFRAYVAANRTFPFCLAGGEDSIIMLLQGGERLTKILRQVDDCDCFEGALLDADTATDAEILGDVRDLRGAAHLDAQLANLHQRARLLALLPAFLRAALVRRDDGDAVEPVGGRFIALLLGSGGHFVLLFRCRSRALRQPVLLFTDLLSLDPFSNGYDMSIENVDLGHQVNDFQPVVWFFGQWVSEEVQLLEERELGDIYQELIEVSQLIITNQQSVEEFELLKPMNILNHVVLAVNFFAPKVGRNVIEINQLIFV